MRVRHKTPTFVSMWMLDVFCCALGCVTLLWLLNTRQAGDEAVANKSALADLASTRFDLRAALTTLDATKIRLDADVQRLTNQLAAVRTESDETARKLGIATDDAKAAEARLDATKVAMNAAEAKIDATAKDLAAARAKLDAADDTLRKKQRDADALAKKATASAATAADLQRLILKKDEELAAQARLAADTRKMLDDLTARHAASQKDMTAATAAAKTDAAKTAADLLAARGQVKDLLKKVDDANASIIDLQGEKAKLADKINKLDRDSESRFAGIAMTGKAVVFVVDMSGSMDKLDAQSAAPHKWPVVCETVAKVMRSIPNLERYQVVVFSRTARWLSGSGEWRKFEGEKTAAAVKADLLRIKPEGDTNLHAAFDLTFGLKSAGLDTVYLFSDGLPTSGPGLTPAQETANPPLEETKRADILSRYLRDKLRATWNRRPAAGDRVKIHAVGFFYESPDLGSFLWALARENDGSFVGMSRP